MSDARSRVAREARCHWGRDAHRRVDWAAVERGLFARIDEQEYERRRALFEPQGRAWAALAVAALAALFICLVGRLHGARSLEPQRVASEEEAGSIVAVDGDGEALVGGRRAAVGAVLRVGDVLQTRGGQITVGRPGKLTFVVERDSRVTVTHVRNALVLDLAAGAVEAQVVPVATGEAFAVDLGRARVAVHGTHLRVARNGSSAVLDLSDGVVSVADAPRRGATLGALVAAPAHAEFSDADPQGTLRVSHEGTSVRAPVVLGQAPPSAGKPATPVDGAPSPAGAVRIEPPASPALPGSPLRPENHPPSSAAGPAPAAPLPPPADPNAAANLAGLVKGCLAERLHAEDVSVTISTTLYLELRDDGTVRSARFDPPVAPDVNACVARSMYRTRFTHGGALTIPLTFKN